MGSIQHQPWWQTGNTPGIGWSLAAGCPLAKRRGDEQAAGREPFTCLMLAAAFARGRFSLPCSVPAWAGAKPLLRGERVFQEQSKGLVAGAGAFSESLAERGCSQPCHQAALWLSCWRWQLSCRRRLCKALVRLHRSTLHLPCAAETQHNCFQVEIKLSLALTGMKITGEQETTEQAHQSDCQQPTVSTTEAEWRWPEWWCEDSLVSGVIRGALVACGHTHIPQQDWGAQRGHPENAWPEVLGGTA